MDIQTAFDLINEEWGTNIQSGAKGRVKPTTGEAKSVDLSTSNETQKSTKPEEKIIRNTFEIFSSSALGDNMQREMRKNAYKWLGSAEFMNTSNNKEYTAYTPVLKK